MATHLVGGNLGYVYLGETFPGSQVYRYAVTMEFYMNCGPNSNFQTFAELLDNRERHLPVGVYLQDPQNPDADKNQQATVELALVSQEQIIPDFPDGCTVGDGLVHVARRVRRHGGPSLELQRLPPLLPDVLPQPGHQQPAEPERHGHRLLRLHPTAPW